MNKRININDLNKNRIKQAIDNLTRFHIDKMKVFTVNLDNDLDIVLQLIEKQQAEIEKKDKIINNAIIEIEKFRQYFSEDLQPDFIRILEILKDKKVIDW